MPTFLRHHTPQKPSAPRISTCSRLRTSSTFPKAPLPVLVSSKPLFVDGRSEVSLRYSAARSSELRQTRMASSIVQNEPVLLVEKAGFLRAIWRWLERIGRSLSSFPALIIAVLIAKIYWTCRDRIGDPDLWWHFRDARYLIEHLRFPNVDMYSFTAAGAPWANHEWLSEIFYYAVFHALGLTGVFILFVSAVAVLFVAVFSLCRRTTDDPLAAGVATMFGMFLAMVGFTPRAQHFGWLCFIALYAILLRFRSEKCAPLWLIP